MRSRTRQASSQAGTGHSGGTALLPVRVIPRASRNEIVGMERESLKIKVTAPPVKGKANDALVGLLAKTLKVRKSQVEIVSGHKARQKMVKVEGIEKNTVMDLLRQHVEKR